MAESARVSRSSKVFIPGSNNGVLVVDIKTPKLATVIDNLQADIIYYPHGGVIQNQNLIVADWGQLKSFEINEAPEIVTDSLTVDEDDTLIAQLEVTNIEQDDLSFERIVNNPKRSIGDSSLKMIYEHAKKNNLSLENASRELIQENLVKPKTKIGLNLFLGLMKNKTADLYSNNMFSSTTKFGIIFFLSINFLERGKLSYGLILIFSPSLIKS